MNIVCRPKNRQLVVNLHSRRRMIVALSRAKRGVVESASLHAALAQRYPSGLMSTDELQALLDSWLCRTISFG
jgi:hypothetical protein